MLRRLISYLNLSLLALALIAIPGVWFIVGSADWAVTRAQEMMARQLAETLGREVSVGPVRASLWRGASVAGVAVAQGTRLRDGALLSVGRVEIKYGWHRFSLAQPPSAAWVREIHLYQPRLYLDQDAQGTLNLQRILPKLKPGPPEKRFRGKVVIHDGVVTFRSVAPFVREGPLEVRLQQVEGTVDMAAAPQAVARLTAEVASGQAAGVQAQVALNPDTGLFALRARVPRLQAAWAYRTFAPPGPATVTSGLVDAAGTVTHAPSLPGATTDFSIQARLEDVGVVTRQLAGQPLTLSGEAWVSPDGAQLPGLQASWAGTELRVKGTVSNFPDPLVDLGLVSDRVPVTTVLSLLPNKLKTGWSLPEVGNLALTATVLGAARDPDVRLQASLRGPTRLCLQGVGTFGVRQASLETRVLGTDQPVVSAQYRLSEVSLPDIMVPPAGAEANRPRQIRHLRCQGVSGTLDLAHDSPLGTVTVTGARADVDQVDVRQLRAKAELNGDTLRLPQVEGLVLGARLSGYGRVLLGKKVLGSLHGSLTGLDLRRLGSLPCAWKEPLGGSANVRFRAQLRPDKIAATGQAWVSDATYQDAQAGYAEATFGGTLGADQAGAVRVSAWDGRYREAVGLSTQVLLSLKDQQVTLHGATVTGPPGHLWATGTLALPESTADLRVKLAEVNAATVGRLVGDHDCGGTVYFDGSLKGSPKHPVCSGKITAFRPAYEGHALNGLTAQISYAQDILEATEFYADYRSAVVSGRATLHGLRAQGKQAALEGSLQGEGLDLERVNDFVSDQLPVAGLAEVSVLVSGTVDRPQAKGLLRMAHVRYQDLLVDRVETPFVADRHHLAVSAGKANAYGAALTFKGDLQFDKPVVLEAQLAGQDLRLEGLAPFWELGLPVAGSVDISSAWVRGPLNNLSGGGRLTCPRVTIGREQMEELDAQWTLGGGTLVVERAAVRAGGGNVTARCSLDYASEDRLVEARLDLEHASVAPLLALAAPLVRLVETRSPGRSRNMAAKLRRWALRLGGAFDGSLVAQGPLYHPQLALDVKAAAATLDGRALPAIEARVKGEGRRWKDLAIALRQGQALVTVDGSVDLDGPVDAMVQGSGLEVAQLRPWIAVQAPLGGRLGFTVAASGATQRPDLQASVDIEQPSLAGIRFDVLTVPLATVSEGAIEVDSLVLRRGEQAINFSGKLPFSWELTAEDEAGRLVMHPGLVPGRPLDLKAEIANTDLAFFPPLLQELRLTEGARRDVAREQLLSQMQFKGTVNSEVTVKGVVGQPALRGYLRLAEGSISRTRWPHPLAPLNVDLAFTGTGAENQVEVKQFSCGYESVRTELSGQVELGREALRHPEGNTYDLRLNMAARDHVLPGGTRVHDLKGGLTLQTTAPGNHVLKAQPLSADVGGGRMTLSGQATLTDFALEQWANNAFGLALKVDRCRVKYPNTADVLVNGDLELTTPPGGRTVAKSRLVLTNGVFTTGSGPKGPKRELAAAPSRFPSPDLDIAVLLGAGVTLRGAGISVPLDPNSELVTITGTPQRPLLTGQVTARRGSASLPSGRMMVEDFRVQYFLAPVRGVRQDPIPLQLTGTVAGRATTTVGTDTEGPGGGESIRITMDISGNLPDAVRIQASSDPPLTEAQIFALIGGLPVGSMAGVSAGDQSLSQALSEQFLTTLATAFKSRVFEPFEEELKRRLGLAELGINFAFDQPVSVKVGKYLLENLLVTYERSITDVPEAYDLEVSYQLRSGLRVTYHQDELGDHRVKVGYSFGF